MENIIKKNAGKSRIVVVGGGFAGINFVKNACKLDTEIILVDKHNYHQFQPLLYQVAISGLEPDSIVAPIRRLFNQSENVRFVMGKVNSVNVVEQLLCLNDLKIEYDYLVIATGSVTNFYGNKNIESKAFGLKTINDALDLRSWILQNLEQASLSPENKVNTHFVIAGGGPAGVEMAGALAEFRNNLLQKYYPKINKSFFKITLIEGGGSVLSVMSQKAQKAAKQALHKMEIDIIDSAIVKDFDGNVVTYEEDGKIQKLHAKTLIWTAGVTCYKIKGIPDSCVNGQNRLIVNNQLQVKDCPNVYAIGDIAYLETDEFPRGLPMVAQVAIQQGKYLAKNIFRPTTDFVYKNKGSMAIIGMKTAVADIKSLFFKGKFGWLIWSFIHLISITSFKNRMVVGFNWLSKYLNYEKTNQLIIRIVNKY